MKNVFKLKSITRNRKVYVTVLVVCALLAGILFYYNNYHIPKIIEETEAATIQKVDINAEPRIEVVVVKDGYDLDKYTEITAEMVDDYFEVKEIPESMAILSGAQDLEELIGFVAKEDLRSGEQVHVESLSGYGKWYEDFDRLKEYPLKSIVAEQVKQGNLVDVIVNYGDGNYDVIIPKVKVSKMVQGRDMGAELAYQDESVELEEQNVNSIFEENEYTLVVAINETDYRNLALASHLGRFETRLYIDEDQPASEVTFNYSESLIKARYIIDKSEQEMPYHIEHPDTSKMTIDEIEEYNKLISEYYSNVGMQLGNQTTNNNDDGREE